jgi:D-alanyl-D-alanine carboxypeptidase/D-alanyl-D-alanine-endopeptidase (penicillin-binding protein 4)
VRHRVAASLAAAALVLVACSSDAPDPDEQAQGAIEEDASAPQASDPRSDEPSDDDTGDRPDEGDAEPTPPPPVDPPAPPATRADVVATAERLLAGALDEGGDGTLAVLVTDEWGREVLAHEPDLPVLPASTLKSVTAAAALVTFGPDARFVTRVDTTAPIDASGVLRGDLVVRAGGDPVLATDEYIRWVYPARPRTSLAELADQLVAAGLTQLDGDLLATLDGWEGPRVPDGWPDRYFSSLDARYHDGLTVDAGLRTIVSYPEPEDSDDDTEDTDDGAEDTDDTGDTDDTEATDDGDDDGDADGGDGQDTDEVDPEELGPPTVRVDHAPDPAQHTLDELARLLEERGVELRGEQRVDAPSGPVVGRLARVESPPLEELLRFAVQRSDNQLTDAIFRAVGRARVGDGSFEGGARGVAQALAGLGVDTEGLVLADGSGLSRDDRITARQLVDLERAMARSRHAARWPGLMAVMGESGTLDARLRGTIAQGRFAGKTGTLRDVTSLAGTTRASDGRRYHLAVLVNDEGSMRWVGRTLTDELVVLLAADLQGCTAREADGADGALGIPPLAVRC